MGVRAGIVVTGTEVLTGRVNDLNGPWLAEQLRQQGVDVGQVIVVGDRPEDLSSALRFLATGCDLLLTTGGLGPTADDLTAELVGQVQGRPVRLDPDLEARITVAVERFYAALIGLSHDRTAIEAGIRKQAMVPEGATVLEPTGTAPGLVVPVAAGRTGPPVIVLPGPPPELRQMWSAALAAPAVRAVLAQAAPLHQRTLRLWRVPEAELAATLRRLDGELTGLEITTCVQFGELEIVSRYHPQFEAAQQRLVEAVQADFARHLFSPDGLRADEVISAVLAGRGWRLALADAATGGEVSARLARAAWSSSSSAAEPGLRSAAEPGLRSAAEPGLRSAAEPGLPSSAGNRAGAPAQSVNATWMLGAVIAEFEAGLVGPGRLNADLDSTLIGSPERAHQLALAVRSDFGADVGLGIGAIVPGSDPTGGSILHVCLAVVTPSTHLARTLQVPGNHVPGSIDTLRRRIPQNTLHLIRQALIGSD